MKITNFKVTADHKYSLVEATRIKYNIETKCLYKDLFDSSGGEMLMAKVEMPPSLEFITRGNTPFEIVERGRLYFIDEACENACTDTRSPLFPGCSVLHVIQQLLPGAKQAELKSRNVRFIGGSVLSWNFHSNENKNNSLEIFQDGSVGHIQFVSDVFTKYMFDRSYKDFLRLYPGYYNNHFHYNLSVRKFLKNFKPIPMEDQERR